MTKKLLNPPLVLVGIVSHAQVGVDFNKPDTPIMLNLSDTMMNYIRVLFLVFCIFLSIRFC